MPDLIATYFPEIASVSSADIQNARIRAATYLKALRPDLDMSPNSVFGDTLLDPFAELLACAEIAIGRVQSDLILENIAKGEIYNCDFVREYLKNFAVFAQETRQVTGVVRISWNADRRFTLPRNILFSFGGNLPEVFRMRLAYPGDMEIYPVGMQVPSNANVRNLSEIAPGVWAVDIPLIGTSESEILAGTLGTTDQLQDEMVNITVLADFEMGNPPDSLPTLAKKARENFYSATFNSAGGAARFIKKEFPDISGASPILTGDAEMTRDSYNVLGIAEGKMDVLVRSRGGFLVDEVTTRVPYVETQNSNYLDKYILKWSPPSMPLYIESIVAVDGGGSEMVIDPSQYRLFSKSSDPVKAPMACSGFSQYDDLWLVIDTPRDLDTGVAQIVPNIDGIGNPYNYFTIKYRSDPMIRVVAEICNNRKNAAIGVDTVVKGFQVIDIDRLVVKYVKEKGVTPNLEGAREEIFQYFASLGHPDVFSEARISDSLYFAQIKDVVSIDCNARIRWGAADRLLPYDAPTPDDDYVAAEAAALTPKILTMTSARDLLPAYRDSNLGTAQETFEACSYRTVTYKLDRDDIHFQEIFR